MEIFERPNEVLFGLRWAEVERPFYRENVWPLILPNVKASGSCIRHLVGRLERSDSSYDPVVSEEKSEGQATATFTGMVRTWSC